MLEAISLQPTHVRDRVNEAQLLPAQRITVFQGLRPLL